jgi:hypothetical protein
METKTIRAAIAAICVAAAALPSYADSSAAKLPYASTKYFMGASGYDTSAVLGETSKLAFPGATLDEIKTLLDRGYIFGGRTNAASLYGAASINGINGVILLPDNWTPPADTNVKFVPGFYRPNTTPDWNINWYSEEDWKKMEETGAVFLPVTGYRHGKTVEGYDFHNTEVGNYWSSTAQRPNTALGLHFTKSNIVPQSYAYRHFGRAVRLVRDI